MRLTFVSPSSLIWSTFHLHACCGAVLNERGTVGKEFTMFHRRSSHIVDATCNSTSASLWQQILFPGRDKRSHVSSYSTIPAFLFHPGDREECTRLWNQLSSRSWRWMLMEWVHTFYKRDRAFRELQTFPAFSQKLSKRHVTSLAFLPHDNGFRKHFSEFNLFTSSSREMRELTMT